MSYVGGKGKATFLFDVLNSPRFDGWAYFEPCCGYCHVLRRVVNKRSYAASDSNALLLILLKAVQDGTPLPEPVSRARYDAQQYDRLVENLTVTERENANRASLSTFRQQATMGVNIIFATITGFLVGYYASNFYTEEMKYRMIAGLVTMVGTIFLVVNLIRAYKGDFTPRAGDARRGRCC